MVASYSKFGKMIHFNFLAYCPHNWLPVWDKYHGNGLNRQQRFSLSGPISCQLPPNCSVPNGPFQGHEKLHFQQ